MHVLVYKTQYAFIRVVTCRCVLINDFLCVRMLVCLYACLDAVYACTRHFGVTVMCCCVLKRVCMCLCMRTRVQLCVHMCVYKIILHMDENINVLHV